MPKKRYKKRKLSTAEKLWVVFWLVFSMSAGILFSFGLLNWLNEVGNLKPVYIGLGMITIAILTGKFTTETALAMRMK